LTFFGRKTADYESQCPWDRFKTPRYETEANTPYFHYLSECQSKSDTIVQFVVVALDNGAGDTGFVGTVLDHSFDLVEEIL